MSSRISFKGKVKIINEDYVLKEKNRDIKYLYDYLSSRDFYGYPDLIDESVDSYKFKYIKNNNYSKQNLSDKYRKTYYDIAAIIKDHLAIGANESEIDNMLKFYWEEDNNDKG